MKIGLGNISFYWNESRIGTLQKHGFSIISGGYSTKHIKVYKMTGISFGTSFYGKLKTKKI